MEFIGEELGYHREEMHDAFKNLFLNRYNEKLKMNMPRSTTSLTSLEFTQYMDKVKMKAAELDIIVPEPTQIKY